MLEKMLNKYFDWCLDKPNYITLPENSGGR